ncbi:MAG: NADP-dependent malic enzyme [Rhodospirillales bacterium]|nr:NADP-dependent malic enzyme [Rhodospirillales bacterium]
MSTDNPKQSKEALWKDALHYHRYPTPGKVALKPTTALQTQRDLALAYSPGVAAPCEEIEKNPLTAYDYTSKGNLVAVITEGTAVLGLGNIGALAAKPVMEGKSVLFKKFANIDSVDVEIDMSTQLEKDADGKYNREEYIQRFVDIVASLEPTYGGINLEDIKAPECFEIERRLKERMNIPVFHDDQHGTAIIVGAAFYNWVHIAGRDIKKIKLVTSGAGASATACLNILIELGLPRENITVCDSKGVVYKGRTEYMDPVKETFAVETNARTLKEAMEGADVFLGLSTAGVVSKDMVEGMGEKPLLMTLANPTPEIMPEEALEAKPNAIICTGRSDYPNQVNNVLCFPFLFRGALDVGATAINEEMKLACVKAIAELARKEAIAEVAAVYSNEDLKFGPEYMIPKPFDPRLIAELPKAVAKAAMDSGVATRPIKDWEAYNETLQSYTVQTNMVMRPVFSRARKDPKRVVYCEGEEENVLRAVQIVIDDNLAKPVIIGRRRVIESRLQKFRLRMEIDKDFQLIDPENDPRYHDYWNHYHEIMQRKGVTPSSARFTMRTNTTAIGALMVHRGEADAVICGLTGQYHVHLKHILDILGKDEGVKTVSSLMPLLLDKGPYFLSDTHVNDNPDVEELVEMAKRAAERVKRFGITPKIALLSYSNFGNFNSPSSIKMREAARILSEEYAGTDIEVEGEMQADSALCEKTRERLMPHSRLSGEANLLIGPNLDASNIAYNMLKVLGNGIPIGPLLMGVAKPAHILTTASHSRRIVNVTALATVDAQVLAEKQKQAETTATPRKLKTA